MQRILHDGTSVKAILTVPATSITGTRWQQFDAATPEAAQAEITRRGLLLLDTPGKRQKHLFSQAAPAVTAPFAKLVEPLTALNDLGLATGDYSAAKAMLNAVVVDSPAQAAVKAARLACYEH